MKKGQFIFCAILLLVFVFIFSIGTVLEFRKDVHSVAPQTTGIAVAVNLTIFFLGKHIPAKQKQHQVIRTIICGIGMVGAVFSIIATILLIAA